MVSALLLLAACEVDDSPPDPCEAAFAADLVTFAEGATMVHGPQGGWHVWVAADLGGTGPLVGAQTTLTRTADGTVLSAGFENLTTMDLTVSDVGEWDAATCTGTFSRAWAYLNDALPATGSPLELICDLEGEEVRIDATVTELETSEVAEVSATTLLALDPSDVAACHP